MPRDAGFNRKQMPRGYLVFWYIMPYQNSEHNKIFDNWHIYEFLDLYETYESNNQNQSFMVQKYFWC